MHLVYTLSSALALVCFFVSIWANIIGSSPHGRLADILATPLGDDVIIHPGVFAAMDIVLSGGFVVVPSLVLNIPQNVHKLRIGGLLVTQCMLVLFGLLILFDTPYAWSLLTVTVLYFVRVVLLVICRVSLTAIPDDANRETTVWHVTSASIMNLYTTWSVITLLLLGAVTILTDNASDHVTASVVKWAMLVVFSLNTLTIVFGVMADVALIWIALAVDMSVAVYARWSESFHIVFPLVIVLWNLTVIMYTFLSVVVCVVRIRRLFPRTYLLDGFQLRALLGSKGDLHPDARIAEPDEEAIDTPRYPKPSVQRNDTPSIHGVIRAIGDKKLT